MAIPARQIVAVTPRLIQAGGNDLVLNGLLLAQNNNIPLSAWVLEFPDADSVGEYFGTTADEYKYATVYFRGYTNSFKKPANLLIAAAPTSARAAWLRSAKYTGTLADLQTITDGAFTISVDGATAATVSGVDFSTATSFSDVATKIQTAMQTGFAGTTCIYSSQLAAFIITSSTSGSSSAITFAESPSSGTDLATTLSLTAATGAVISQGTAALSMGAILDEVKEHTQNWVTFSTIWQPQNTDMLAAAKWANDQGIEYLYLPWSNESALTTQGSTTSIADLIEDAQYSATAGVYAYVNGATNNAYDLAAFVSGAIASIDWNRTQGTITLAFKQQSGLAANVENATDAQVLINKKWNFYGNYATRNDNFIWFYPARMFGDYNFIDPYINAIWLDNAIQVAMMAGLENYSRIPYTPAGYEKIRASIIDVVIRAKKNGVIDTGVALSEAQKAQLTSEYGSSDIVDELNANGYCLQVEDTGANVRVNRESPNVSLWYTYGGSVQRVEISATAVL